MHSEFMSWEDQRKMYERAEANGDVIDWDGDDEREMTLLDYAMAREFEGDAAGAAELRAQYEAEEEQRELQELADELARLAAEHELRKESAKQAARTRKQRQAERRAAVAAAEAILADARRKDST